MPEFVVTPDAAAAGRPSRCDADCRGLHSYVADGRRVCWRPEPAADSVAAPRLAELGEARFAVDAEIEDAPVPDALAARFGVHEFWQRWTRAEALAKVSHVPILVWLSTRGLAADTPRGVLIEHQRQDGLLICTARAA